MKNLNWTSPWLQNMFEAPNEYGLQSDQLNIFRLAANMAGTDITTVQTVHEGENGRGEEASRFLDFTDVGNRVAEITVHFNPEEVPFFNTRYEIWRNDEGIVTLAELGAPDVFFFKEG